MQKRKFLSVVAAAAMLVSSLVFSTPVNATSVTTTTEVAGAGRTAEEAQVLGAARSSVDSNDVTVGTIPDKAALDSLKNLTDFDGTVLGISAGSMNAASIVYAQPEEEGEAADPNYRRFLKGLGLTNVMLLPHYQDTKDRILDGKKLFEEVTYPDSFGRQFIAIRDGSYLYADGTAERICGEAYLIQNGTIRKICDEGKEYPL